MDVFHLNFRLFRKGFTSFFPMYVEEGAVEGPELYDVEKTVGIAAVEDGSISNVREDRNDDIGYTTDCPSAEELIDDGFPFMTLSRKAMSMVAKYFAAMLFFAKAPHGFHLLSSCHAVSPPFNAGPDAKEGAKEGPRLRRVVVAVGIAAVEYRCVSDVGEDRCEHIRGAVDGSGAEILSDDGRSFIALAVLIEAIMMEVVMELLATFHFFEATFSFMLAPHGRNLLSQRWLQRMAKLLAKGGPSRPSSSPLLSRVVVAVLAAAVEDCRISDVGEDRSEGVGCASNRSG